MTHTSSCLVSWFECEGCGDVSHVMQHGTCAGGGNHDWTAKQCGGDCRDERADGVDAYDAWRDDRTDSEGVR